MKKLTYEEILAGGAKMLSGKIPFEEEDPSKADVPPVVSLVDRMLAESVREGATEILFEDDGEHFFIYYRFNESLSLHKELPWTLRHSIRGRLRLMANLYEDKRKRKGEITVNLGKKQKAAFSILFGRRTVVLRRI